MGRQSDEKTNLGTDVVWQNLDCVSDEQSRPSGIIEDVVDEDHRDHRIGGSLGSIDCETGGADCPDYEDAKHATGSD